MPPIHQAEIVVPMCKIGAMKISFGGVLAIFVAVAYPVQM